MRLRILDAPAKPAGIPAYFGTVHGALRSGIRKATRLGAPKLISPAR